MSRSPVASIQSKLARIQRGASPRVVDLFSGCGGMSLGFQRAGCEILAGIELDPIRAQTHALNFHAHLDAAARARHAEGRDVTALDPVATLRELNPGQAPDVDILVGGPPCQAYARVGRAKLREIAQHPEAYQRDPRGQLYAAYIRWVAELKPLAIVMENVPDILNYGGINVAEVIVESLAELGYVCRYTLLNAAFYGVPQTRERWYLVGVHKALGIVPDFPTPTHFVELPKGYAGTRARALEWGVALLTPKHATPLPVVGSGLPPAVTCRVALDDLPRIPENLKNRRGARNLRTEVRYRHAASNAYQQLMRQWKPIGHPSPDAATKETVSAHVVRTLLRDWETFRRMPQGSFYPTARQVAERRFQEALDAQAGAGRPIPEGSDEWHALRASIVPPYDDTKFPNKWWKLQADFPSRTLLAHLSHDSYSHIHYDDREARTISVREAARLQSFPDHFEFSGAMNAAFGQIGNAVPPLMAFALGGHLLGRLREQRVTLPGESASPRQAAAAK